MIDNASRARVLTEALPYIRRYIGRILVIKYGGSAMQDSALQQGVMEDVALLSLIGVKVVLVHGGGPEISALLSRMGKKSVFVDGLRVTDDETMNVVQMVLCGKVNKDLVNLLGLAGARAVGISGMDGRLLQAKPLDERLGHVGEVTQVDAGLIFTLLEQKVVPVVSTVGCDKEGNLYNVNADTAAAHIAGVLGAEGLIQMTDVAGILRQKDDPTSLISAIHVSDAAQLMREGIIAGGMIPKVTSCVEAIRRGVGRVFILDGRVPHAILIEMLTDEGLGTMLYGE